MRRIRRAAVSAGLAVVLLAPACSTESPPPAPPAPSPSAHGSLAECLRAQAVDVTGPVSPAGVPAGVDPAVWEQAMEACSTLAPGPAGP